MTFKPILLALAATVASTAFGTTWDLAADFSYTDNPNGQWNYGRYDSSGTFFVNSDPVDFFGFATGWDGGQGSGRPFVGQNYAGDIAGSTLGQVVVHPDFAGTTYPYAGVRFMVAAEGDYHVSGKFFAGDSATVSEFVSYDDLAFNFQAFDTADDQSFDFNQHMMAGEYFDFFVGPNSTGDVNFATTPLDVTITTQAVPEPATLSLLGLAALFLRRRK